MIRPDDLEWALQEIAKYEMEQKLREEMAALVHEIWSHWMKHLFDQGHFSANGVWIMPKEKVVRWTFQMNTPYEKLSEKEKDSDCEQADKIIELLDKPVSS